VAVWVSMAHGLLRSAAGAPTQRWPHVQALWCGQVHVVELRALLDMSHLHTNKPLSASEDVLLQVACSNGHALWRQAPLAAGLPSSRMGSCRVPCCSFAATHARHCAEHVEVAVCGSAAGMPPALSAA
jgi:hypothetical protein